MQADICEFKINDTRISENDVAQLERLVVYLQKRVHWLTSAPRFAEIFAVVSEVHTQDVPLVIPEMPIAPVKREIPIPTLPNGASSPGKRIIDYMMYALSILGDNARMNDCYDKALEIGFVPGTLVNPNPTESQARKSFANIARGTRYQTWVKVKGGTVSITPIGAEKLAYLKENNLIPEKVLAQLDRVAPTVNSGTVHSQNVLTYSEDAGAS